MVELHPECGTIFVEAFGRRKLDLTIFSHNTQQTVRLGRSNWTYEVGSMICKADVTFDDEGVAERFEITENGLCLISGILDEVDYDKGGMLVVSIVIEMFPVRS